MQKLTNDQKAAYPAIYEHLYQPILTLAEQRFDQLLKTEKATGTTTKLQDYNEKQQIKAISNVVIGLIRTSGLPKGTPAPTGHPYTINPQLEKIACKEIPKMSVHTDTVLQVQTAIGLASQGEKQISTDEADTLILEFAEHVQECGLTTVMQKAGAKLSTRTSELLEPSASNTISCP